MKKTIILSIIFVATTFTSFSQTKQESIKQLFHSMQVDSTMEKTFRTIIPAITAQLPKGNNDPAKSAALNQFMSSLMSSAKDMCKKMLDEDLVVIYDKLFTENEIKDLIVFYNTPTGKKMIEKQPEMQMEMTRILMQKYIPELQKNIADSALKLKPAE